MLNGEPQSTERERRAIDAIVIGASAGAVEALGVLLPLLPPDLGVPVIVVVHVPPNRPSLLADLFGMKCALSVREVEDKLSAEPNTVWFAPPGYHLLVEREGSFALSTDEPVNYSRPSIDVLFESAADVYRERLLGLVLTGANHDGAAGAARIRELGGYVGVQDPDTAVVATMPRTTLERVQPHCVGSLSTLAAFACKHALRRAS